jgi:hypothetical protein
VTIYIKFPNYIIPLLLNYKHLETQILRIIFCPKRDEINEQPTNTRSGCRNSKSLGGQLLFLVCQQRISQTLTYQWFVTTSMDHQQYYMISTGENVKHVTATDKAYILRNYIGMRSGYIMQNLKCLGLIHVAKQHRRMSTLTIYWIN